MMIILSEKDKKMKSEVIKWIQIDNEGNCYLKGDAPDYIKKDYNLLRKKMAFMD
ncbi:hypothetical protein [Faecalimonas sp.]